VNQEIVNRVASSPLITIDLKNYIPDGERVEYDLKNDLHEGLILREKEFRSSLKNRDWTQYKDKHVAIYCSTDAIVPKWAYMLLASKLAPFARTIFYGNLNDLENELLIRSIQSINPTDYKEKKLVIRLLNHWTFQESILNRPYHFIIFSHRNPGGNIPSTSMTLLLLLCTAGKRLPGPLRKRQVASLEK